MSYENRNKNEDPIISAPGEFRAYPSGHVEKVFKLRGQRFGMEALAAEVARNPYEAGAVYVQTLVGVVDGVPDRRRYYFDGTAMFDPQRNRATFLKEVIDNEAYDITVGGPWNSPMGTVEGKVETVVIPWAHGYDPGAAIEGHRSPTAVGREHIDSLLAAHGM